MSPELPHFDPIVVREQRDRQIAIRNAMSKGEIAASALLWFAEYAKSGPKGVVKVVAEPVAGSTPGVESVKPFITAAAKELEAQIVVRAIEMAIAQQKEAQSALKTEKA